jgi:sporulation protein YunB
LTLCTALFYLFTTRLMPLIKTTAVNNARNMATQTINNAAGKVLKEKQIDYDKLMTLEKDSRGRITAVKADSLQIDLLKYEITNEAIKEINAIDSSELGVPVGTVIGGQLLSGTGPRINVKIEPVGNVETQIVNGFTSTGINQTRQQIMLSVKASITIMVSSYNITTSVESNFAIADSVIVGNVPDYYTVVEDSGASGENASQKIFTYGKNQSAASK